MRVFITGATGFIGSTLVKELIANGHQVLGLCRSEDKARSLEAAGAKAHRGSLEDPASLRAGAGQADAVIHTAFDHDFSHFAANCEKDRGAIRALGSALAGSDRPLLITSGTGMGEPGDGRPAREDIYNLGHPNPRSASEQAGQELLETGVAVSVMRLPQVHDVVRQGLITPCIAIARQKGYCAYVGEGRNRWPAAHVADVARLYRLAVERRKAGERYHAVAEQGITLRDIMNVIGAGLAIPVKSITAAEAADYFGWLAPFASMDLPASSDWTRRTLNWHPNGPGLIEDLERAFEPVRS
jgi:nucleoside-diphosphate-sugar epimerase